MMRSFATAAACALSATQEREIAGIETWIAKHAK